MWCVLYTDSLLMAQQVSERSRGWVWVLVAVAACFGIFFYVHTEHTVAEVSAAKVEYHTLAQRKSTNGRVAPLDDFEAHAPLAGVVDNIYVKLGEKVQSGQQLVRMNDSEARKDLAAAQASLESSEASLQAMEHGGTQDERLTANANLSTATTHVEQDKTSLT